MTHAIPSSAMKRTPGQSSFRKVLLWAHTWIGLTVGLAMLLLACTGGIVVMRPFLEDSIYGGLMRAPACAAPLPLDVLAADARSAHPDKKLSTIALHNDVNASVAVQFTDRDYVYLDSCSGEVMGVQNTWGGLFGVADSLHRMRFLPKGKTVAGWANVFILLILVIGGVVLWWPKNKASLKAGLVYNTKLPGVARTLSLHRAIGIYVAAVLLALSLTGVPLAFDWAKNLIQVATGTSPDGPRPPAALTSTSKGKPAEMEAVWDRFRSEAPDWTWAEIHYPKSGVFTVEYLERGAPYAEAKSHMYLDAQTVRPIQIYPYQTRTPLGRKIYLYIMAIHTGLLGGFLYPLILFLACVSVPVQAYSGVVPYLRKKMRGSVGPGLTLKVVAKRMEAEGICGFELSDIKGRPLPAFSAGSHISLTIRPGLVRQYSLCNDPRETHRYQIAILRHEPSRGGSSAMHDEIGVGDVLQASPPKNHFGLAHGPTRSILIAGGIGITPILCMAERMSNIGEVFQVHYCVRSRSQAAFTERIAASPFGSCVHYHVSTEGSRLDVRRLLETQSRDTHIYVCGSPALIDEVVGASLALGWADEFVHREYFVATEHDTAEDKPFDIVVASTGQIIHVGKDQSALEALAATGIELPSSCSEGVCGTCMTRVIEGDLIHLDRVLTEEEKARNDQFTPCCSRAKGARLVLDL